LFGSRIAALGLAAPTGSWRPESGAFDASRLTGISQRRVCGAGEDSLTLARRAAFRCIDAAGVRGKQLDAVLFAGITRFTNGLASFQLEPALAQTLASDLGCPDALCFDLTNACAGVMTALSMGDLLIGSGDAQRVLVVSGEYLSHVGRNAAARVDRWNHPELASLTLGDAGGALLLTKADSPGFLAASFATFPEHASLCTAGPARNAPGGVMHTDAAAIHLHAIREAPAIIACALQRAGLRYAEIDCVIPHQTSLRAIRAGRRHFAEHFGEDAKHWAVDLAGNGNTGTCTHLVSLGEAVLRGTAAAGDLLMFLVFASGLVVGSLIYRVTDRIAVARAGLPARPHPESAV
jgi:3-oxoacyl-[acyl-carrier-protein] synthase-3